jgi:uncharacterized membrane protein YhaH (DUF805 family)
MDWKTLFLSADGRIDKRDFWIGFAILFVAGLVLGMIPVLGLISILLIYPWVCVYAKRLHDFGRSAWLILAPVAVTAVLMIAAIALGGMAMMGAGLANNETAMAGSALAMGGAIAGVALLSFLIWIGFALWVGLTNGDPAENRFGPPPVSLTSGAASPPPAV